MVVSKPKRFEWYVLGPDQTHATSIPIETLFFNSDLNAGTLECANLDGTGFCKSGIWCKHIEEVTRSGVDQEMIWWKPENEEYPSSREIQVPIFPTWGFWSIAILDFFGGTIGAPCYKVSFDEPAFPSVAEIGFIHPGEGRAALRNLMLESMYEANTLLKCNSTLHGFRQEKDWQDSLKSSVNGALQQRWSLYTTDKCISCLRVNNGFSQPDDDLIPERM